MNSTWIPNIFTLEAKPNLGVINGPPVPATQDAMAKWSPSLSLDGSKLAYVAFGGLQRTRFEVRLQDLSTGETRALPMRGLGFGQMPCLSPDGTVLAYRDLVDGKRRTFLLKGGPDAAPREVCDSCLIVGFFADLNSALVKEDDSRLFKQNLATGEKTLLIEAVAGKIQESALGPDGRWVSFILGKPDGRVALCIAPLSGMPTPEKDWIVLFEDDHYLGSPAWSPDGNRIFYLSERDGRCSVWTQRLDPRTKRPGGDAQAAYRSPQFQVTLNFPPGNGAVAVSRDKVALWMANVAGNIYLAAPKWRL